MLVWELLRAGVLRNPIHNSGNEEGMHTLAVPNWGLGLPTSSPFKPATGKSSFSGREIADGALRLAYRRHLLQSPVSSIRSEGKRRGRSPRKNTASDKSAEESNASDGESSDPSNQEEIIALFRRIQSSISKEGSVSAKKSSSNNAKEKQSLESVLDVLQQSPTGKRVKGKGPQQEGSKILSQRTGAPKREPRPKENSLRGDPKLSRPPSNFAKRSPIPVAVIPKEKITEGTGEELAIATTVKDTELRRVDELKLTELKELAKSRGLKGYSKLKKGELVEQLKRMLQS